MASSACESKRGEGGGGEVKSNINSDSNTMRGDEGCEEIRRLRAENAELALRVVELQEAAEVDEAEMEAAVAEMEAVMEDMAEKLGAAEMQLEKERKEFGMKLQMLAMEGADQELARREREDGKEMTEETSVDAVGKAQAAEAVDESAGLRRRIAELEAELETVRLSRASSAEAAQMAADLGEERKALSAGNPVADDGAGAVADAGTISRTSSTMSDAVPLSRSLTPRTAKLRGILGRTMTELKARRAERARAAAERAAERLVQSASSGANSSAHLFGDLTASAALAALSPEKKLLNPDDDAVVEMLARAEQRRRKSSTDAPMRSWEHQPPDVIRAELIRRGVGEHQRVTDKDALLKLLMRNM